SPPTPVAPPLTASAPLTAAAGAPTPSAAAGVPPALPAPTTTSPHPAVRTLAGGLGVVAALALVKLLLHLATTGLFGYGFFVDELYFLACSRHLAWGFVDMPPLFPAVTALVRAVLGESLLAIRLLPALAGTALVVLTGLMARDLGGRRFAQGIAALAVLTAPIWLVLHSIHTMNALEQLFWAGCAWLVIRIVRDDRPRLWVLFGLVAGLGLLNKHSMAFFGLALAAGLLLTPERRAFRSRWLWLGGLLAALVFLPNLVWVVEHHFPHFEMLANIKRDGRDVQANPLQFMVQQILLFNPLALPLWLGGLAWLLADPAGRRYRVLGITYLAILAEMFLLDGRPYYPAPAYPMLFAAGGVAVEQWLAARRWRGPRLAYAALLALSGAILAPLFAPLLPPETMIRYARAIGVSQPRIETHRLGPLPQLMADRFGWQEMAEEVARVYRSLPAEDRARAAVFGQNYGQAGAIDLFGPALGMPPAVSGHLSYFLWGPRGYTGEVMIVMGDRREVLARKFRRVELAGHVFHPYSMPYQHFDIFVCRGPVEPLPVLWPQLKQYH
ncbi:MAG: glycosyltransferase family 39 protein, partial [Acidobacteriota bacterium]|nr:glycosyltransferase family 39 protein [Acidobacteriota bacterium]